MPVFGGQGSSPVKGPPEREVRSPVKYKSPVKIKIPPATTPGEIKEENEMRETILRGQVRS